MRPTHVQTDRQTDYAKNITTLMQDVERQIQEKEEEEGKCMIH